MRPGGPFIEANGPFFERDEGDGGKVMALLIDERHLNIMDVVHGGALLTFADFAMARYMTTTRGETMVTVRMTSDFLRPVVKGDWVEARVESLRMTRSIAFARVTLTARGKTVLTAEGTFQVLARQRAAQV